MGRLQRSGGIDRPSLTRRHESYEGRAIDRQSATLQAKQSPTKDPSGRALCGIPKASGTRRRAGLRSSAVSTTSSSGVSSTVPLLRFETGRGLI